MSPSPPGKEPNEGTDGAGAQQCERSCPQGPPAGAIIDGKNERKKRFPLPLEAPWRGEAGLAETPANVTETACVEGERSASPVSSAFPTPHSPDESEYPHMAGVNKVILIGNLGRDPELRYTQSGQAVANFSLATSESWKDKNSGERKESTEWHRITTWGKTAELASQYLSKGRTVYVEGRLQTREYEDKDGIKRKVTEVVASNVTFLGGQRGDGGGQGGGDGQSGGGGQMGGGEPSGGDDGVVPF